MAQRGVCITDNAAANLASGSACSENNNETQSVQRL
jgi:hypothetical protein